jgi:phage/plasmid-associated DNA primase
LIGRLYGSVTPSAVLAGRTVKDVPQLLASVMGRRFITPASEVPARAEWRSEVVKAFVGNDTLLAERKYEQPIEFRPQGALWVAGNHYLTHEDRDDSMTNRIVYLTFCQPSGRRLTPAEVSRLIDAEADAILWWLAEIHSQMQAEATTSTRIPLTVSHYDPDVATPRTDPNVNYWSDVAYAYPPTMVPDLDIITTETDPWSMLWEECYEVTGQPEDWTSNADLYAVYRQWALQQEGISIGNVLQRATFTQRVLKGRPGVSSKRKPGTGERGSVGIALTAVGRSLLTDARMA